MRFTGTLIEDLMATVERAEQRAARSDEPRFAEQMFAEQMVVESMFVKTWFASVQENADYDSKFLGVA
jgi:hypothetical protein